MLDTKFLDESRGKDSGGECTTEDGTELGVKTSNTHILELKVRGEDRIRCCPIQHSNISKTNTSMPRKKTENNILLRTGLDLNRCRRILHERHICPLHDHPCIPDAAPAPPTPLRIRQLHDSAALDHRLQILSMKLEHQHLSERKDHAGERLDERPRHLVRGELFCDLEPAFEEADFEGDVLEEGYGGERVDRYAVSGNGEADPLALEGGGADAALGEATSVIMPCVSRDGCG